MRYHQRLCLGGVEDDGGGGVEEEEEDVNLRRVLVARGWRRTWRVIISIVVGF